MIPGSTYLIRLEKELKSTNIEFSRDDISKANSDFKKKDLIMDEIGALSLSLRSGDREQDVSLYIDPENLIENRTDLNSISAFLPEEYSTFPFSFIQGEDFLEVVSIPKSSEQVISMPMSFAHSTNDSYTLSVKEWKNIPSGWSIKILDTFNDKEYNLRSDFSITFDHTPNNDDETLNTDRFEIQVYPEVANQKAEESLSDVPKEIELNQNYPNPFNPVTTISFYLPDSRDVKLSIFNIVGQPVAVLFEGRLSSGRQQFEWDATDKPSGMYIYQLEVGDKVMTRKMTLVK
jgi:hypothetical protein